MAEEDKAITLYDRKMVDKVEIHFIYPFHFCRTSLVSSPKLERRRLSKSSRGDHELFVGGEDEEIEETQRQQKLAKQQFGDAGDSLFDGLVESTRKGVTNRQLRDAEGNQYYLNDVYLRYFRFDMGMLRFAIVSDGPVTVQSVLDVQNGVMRLDNPKRAKRLEVQNAESEKWRPFEPCEFIFDHLPPEVRKDKEQLLNETKRLFVFTIAAISGLGKTMSFSGEKADLDKAVAYKITNMEWASDEAVKLSTLNKFYDNCVFDKFVTAEGGLWSSFHRDAGSILVFSEEPMNLQGMPFFEPQRSSMLLNSSSEKMDVCGSSWPFVAFSLFEPVIFQRHFLVTLDEDLRKNIMKTGTGADRNISKALQRCHAQLLRFQAHYAGKPIHTTAGGCTLFDMWQEISGINKLKENVGKNISDADAYFNDVVQKANQSRLDVLTVVLGFLGFAQLVSGIFSSYWTTAKIPADDRDIDNAIIPSALAGAFIIIGVLFILRLKIHR